MLGHAFFERRRKGPACISCSNTASSNGDPDVPECQRIGLTRVSVAARPPRRVVLNMAKAVHNPEGVACRRRATPEAMRRSTSTDE